MYVDLVRCNYNPLKWVNRRIEGIKRGKAKDYPEITVVSKDRIKTSYGIFYDSNSCNLDILRQVENEYRYDDIRSDDVLMDIGANVGMFSLKLRDKLSHIYAVEPLFFEELDKNIKMNGAWFRTHIITYGLGNEDQEITFDGKTQFIKCKTLSQLFKLAEVPITFLKLDCEGGEWCIKPEELKGIRRIEAEVHNFDGRNPQDFVNMLIECGFRVVSEVQSDGMTMVHAYRN